MSNSDSAENLGARVKPGAVRIEVVRESRLGLAESADEDTSAAIESFVGGNEKHLEDALIAATARHLGVPLVTNEGRRSRFETHFPGLTLWKLDDLRDLARAILRIPPRMQADEALPSDDR
jgi:hypothetical protein